MNSSAILPAAIIPAWSNSDLLRLTYTFNRWLKMLVNFGKLDKSVLGDDFTLISRVIKTQEFSNNLKRAVQCCRDYALSECSRIGDFINALTETLNILCKWQESKEIKIIEKSYADQGMTEKYRPLTKRLAKEKIRKIGKEYILTDRHTDDKETTKLVRRFVEKRAAQTVHKNSRRKDRESNHYRQSVRRAISFSLYSKRFVDYDIRLRAPGTHWKVIKYKSKGKKVLAAKFSYNTYKEAAEACERFSVTTPDDTRPLSAYRCDYCGKWHIGHVHTEQPN